MNGKAGVRMDRLRRASEVVGTQLERFRCMERVLTMDAEVSFRALVDEADAAVRHAYCYLQDRDE